MRRIVMALLGTALGTALLVGLKAQGAGPGAEAVAAAPLEQSPGGAEEPSGPTGPSIRASAPAPSGSTAAKPPAPVGTSTTPATRTILGNAYPAKEYGDVQVKVIMTGTHIDDIIVVQMSNRPLNAPELLRQEALAKQSANLTNVSGATYTCQAYTRSLQSALDKA